MQIVCCKPLVLPIKILVNKGTVLLSPACASFDKYQDFIERGNDFISSINKLKNNILS